MLGIFSNAIENQVWNLIYQIKIPTCQATKIYTALNVAYFSTENYW